jgi:hypothetical protein
VGAENFKYEDEIGGARSMCGTDEVLALGKPEVTTFVVVT